MSQGHIIMTIYVFLCKQYLQRNCFSSLVLRTNTKAAPLSVNIFLLFTSVLSWSQCLSGFLLQGREEGEIEVKDSQSVEVSGQIGESFTLTKVTIYCSGSFGLITQKKLPAVISD